MSYSVVLLLTLLVLLVSWIYSWSKKKYAHFEELNVPFRKPTFPLGNVASFTEKRTNVMVWFKDIYLEYRETHPFVGIFVGFEPVVVVTDLDIIKCILTTNFSQFTGRTFYTNERDDPLSSVIITMDGERWRNMRTKLSATFSKNNVRKMFEPVHGIGEKMLNYLDVNFVQKNQPIDAEDLSGRFILDSIGTCAFGLDCGAWDEDPYFIKASNMIFPYNRFGAIYWLLTSTYGDFSRTLRLKMLPKFITEYFAKLISKTVKYREENNIVQSDFLNTLIQMKNQGCLIDDESGEELGKISFEQLQAQAFAMFFAGFFTSRVVLSFALYELANNPEVQEKLRGEIMEKISPEGELTHEDVERMTYLEQVLNETLRKYPPYSSITRSVSEESRLPGTTYQLKKGQHVYIPVMGIHYDPDIYPDPDRFDPERMTEEKIRNRHPCAFLPYGLGPRICMGYNFGHLQVKSAIVKILSKYRLSVSAKTKQPLQFLPYRLHTVVGEMLLDVVSV